MAIQLSSSNIIAAGFEDQSDLFASPPQLFVVAPCIVTTAHPFSDEDLRAFEAAGEHPGLD
jgi:hypothetical protein